MFSTLLGLLPLAGVAQALSIPRTTGGDQVEHALWHCNAAFFEQALPEHAALERVETVAAGGTFGEGAANLPYPVGPTNLPPLCALVVNVTSSPSSSYRFGLLLPDAWNDRFLAVGNGGFAGGINWLSAGSGTHYGFAVVSTDTGHNSSVTDATWALNEPEKQADWGWRSLHGSVALGKTLTAAYYGNRIRYAYYSGCSTGGRQGLKEVQIDPDSFDGALIGSAAWDTDNLNTYVTQLGIYDLPVGAPNFINYTRFPVIGAEIVAQCDGADGVLDGIVSAPERCNVDYSRLQCGSPTSALNASVCFTSEQIQTIQNIYSDWRSKETGDYLYSGLLPGSEDMWYAGTLLGGTEPSPFGVGFAQDFLYGDPGWQWQTFNDSIVADAHRVQPGQATADQYDLSAFRNGGGKIIMYHGLADGLVPTKGSELYYNRTEQVMGNDIDDFLRLYLVPGMQHCYDTAVDAPWYINGEFQADLMGTDVWSVPGFVDAKHDALLALLEWTEHGRAPTDIVATTWVTPTNASSGVLRQRPLCPYPQTARWNRYFDINRASSWYCSD
ncbi:Tannase/feruloyl esterase [Niveomyces insectorum RCEF 264]|uniref:Carboxylic ester hydrolase n=1 Tax=Niveomyces insectorum RCEF 264 TaxID=1081102 RepID=A0A167LXG1_9HYPO|nr:Tannase/feruloyl esterase [Niveomyces insectorum RCEF 264]